MPVLSEKKLQTRWRERWDNFLSHIQAADTAEAAQNALRDKVIIGNAERKIAGGHEGREILELLQNARDAIWQGEAEHGRVYVGVYDEGVLVANTGSRFDLFDPQVEDAVTMIGETGKGDDDQSIGHKGVGLKSILATGDAFEIFTRPDQSSDDILAVQLSRAYLVATIRNRLGQDSNISELTEDLDDATLQELLTNSTSDETLPLTDGIQDSISKLPLFNFPVPLAMNGPDAATDPVRSRVRELLTDSSDTSVENQFRTAVFIRYEDSEWRSQLSDIGASTPEEEDTGSLEDRPQRIWEYLSATASDDGLQPETLVQLGGIEELTLERATDGGSDTVRKEQWEIHRDSSPNVATPDLAHSEVDVSIHSPDDTETIHRFDQFQFANARQHHTTLLVNKAADGDSVPTASYPLYLFYPIEGTSAVELPFCLHGRFRVETNRKDLSSNNLATNWAVLQEGLDLIELVSEEVATAATDSSAPTYSPHLPWCLLPSIPDADEISEPTSNDELFDWFRLELFERLGATACIPTVDGPRQPEDTLLHWDRSVLEGQLAYRTLIEHLERSVGTAPESTPLLIQEALHAILDIPATWRERIQTLLAVKDEQTASRTLLQEWVEQLATGLAMQDGDPPAQIVPASAARTLLQGTVTLLTAATEGDESLAETLTDLGDSFDSIYLLPCRIREVDPDEELALVTIERRQTPTGGQRTQRRVRSVIWDIESATRDIERPPTPPRTSNMTVYFLDDVIQEDAAVHHVLSTAGRVWGLRAYEGIPSFVRSLLDTFADGRHETVEPIDFAFLTALVDRIGAESDDLQMGEGEFFPLPYLKNAITQQEGDQRANLRRRIQLRTCELQLHQTQPQSIAEAVLSDEWQAIREETLRSDEEQQVDDDTEVTAEWTDIPADQYPAPTWPSPGTDTWETFREQIKRDVSDADFVRALSLLGTGSLPGIRVLWMYGDDHPSMRRDHHWSPTEWDTDDFTDSVPDIVEELQATLSENSDYPSLLTGVEHHPQTSADHSPKCDVKTDGDLDQVNLASWVWIDDVERLAAHGHAVREVLRRHGDGLVSTLLQTGWSCNNGHKRRSWTSSVPSLLNWQLRGLEIWDPVVDIDEELADRWAEYTSQLRFAVRKEGSRGAQAARMFPHVDDDSGFSEAVLDTLDVRPVSELGPTGATRRFQQLQSVLVDGPLPEDEPARLWIPGGRINDWNQAYTQLLQPLVREFPDDPAEQRDDLNWGALTHLPLRDGDQWLTAPIEWIQDNADQIRYYQDQSPKPWELQTAEENDYYILPRPRSGPFVRLATALGVDQLQASKLVLNIEDDDLTIVTDQYDDRVAEFQQTLTERRDLLVASTERSDEEEIVDTAENLGTAAANIAVAESFPDDVLRQLSDPASALYATDDGEEALLLNAADAGDAVSLQGLSMGIALLVERPTKVATFREALRSDVEVSELESRWKKRTFPIETVKQVLGSNALQSFERDLVAVTDLLDRLDCASVETDPLLDALEDADSERIEVLREWFATGEQPDTDADATHDLADVSSVIRDSIADIHAALPDELQFVVAGLFSESVTHWVRELEAQHIDETTTAVVIGWLDAHRGTLDRPPFDSDARQAYVRLQTVAQLWEQTDSAELTALDTWSERLRELHSSASPAWSDPIPEAYATTLDCPPFVAHVSLNSRVQTLLEAVCEEISDDLPEVDFDWYSLVTTYVEDGTIPEPDTDRGAQDHQERAFAELATAITTDSGVESGGADGPLITGSVTGPNGDGSLSVSTGGGRGGGSTQYRGRGQQAEAYVMAGVLDRIASWLDNHPAGDMHQFRSRFKRLYSEKQDRSYQWHVENVWSADLLPILRDSAVLDTVTVRNWRTTVDEDSFSEFPLVRLVNVTMERGPGFDVIDPLGPLSDDDGIDDFGLQFVPVEVKAVDGTTPPFNFRLTTNEYRQARAFIRDGSIPYVIRLVSVPDVGTPDWPSQTEIAAEKVLRTEAELDSVVESQRFEEVVKGGYMNMQIE
jgi:hypothetical protein